MGHKSSHLVTLGIVLAALIVLFPEWYAVHPSNPTLIISVKRAVIGRDRLGARLVELELAVPAGFEPATL
jgi:hypothetical protein